MRAWDPILDPVWVIVTLFIIAALFYPVGSHMLKMSRDIVEMVETYDSHVEGNFTNCGIDGANEGKVCTIQFEVEKDMKAPVLVYYELENFHQNHRDYEYSRDDSQLLGSLDVTENTELRCKPLLQLGNITLNPCGFIANTFFNDVITFVPNANSQSDLEMVEDGIAWKTDLTYKFKQPMGFKSMECESCDDCECTSPDWSCKEKYVDENGKCHKYFYPNDESTQYLYETYPMKISPLDGVTNEHFVVWMRVAALSNFRKLYGYFESDIKAGEILSFQVVNNWDVKSFKGSKALVVTTTNTFGGKNDGLGKSFITVGIFCAICGVFFSLKHLFKPRKLAHDKYLKYKEE